MRYVKHYSPEDYPDPAPVGICPICGEPVEANEPHYTTEDGPVHTGGKRAVLTEGNMHKYLSCAMIYIIQYGQDTLADVLGLA